MARRVEAERNPSIKVTPRDRRRKEGGIESGWLRGTLGTLRSIVDGVARSGSKCFASPGGRNHDSRPIPDSSRGLRCDRGDWASGHALHCLGWLIPLGRGRLETVGTLLQLAGSPALDTRNHSRAPS